MKAIRLILVVIVALTMSTFIGLGCTKSEPTKPAPSETVKKAGEDVKKAGEELKKTSEDMLKKETKEAETK